MRLPFKKKKTSLHDRLQARYAKTSEPESRTEESAVERLKKGSSKKRKKNVPVYITRPLDESDQKTAENGPSAAANGMVSPAADTHDVPNDLEREMLEEARIEEKKYRSEKRRKILTRIGDTVILVMIMYVLLLIYGVFCTEYVYNDKGTIEPLVMSVEDIKEKESFNDIFMFYIQSRTLYEKTLELDYMLANAETDSDYKTIATKYEELLENEKKINVTNLSVKLQGAAIDPKYGSTKNMLLSWVQSDIAVYLQNISAAILNDSSEYMNYAIEDRTRTYDNFMLITSNFAAIGEQIKGVNITSLYTWSPDRYISETMEGVKY